MREARGDYAAGLSSSGASFRVRLAADRYFHGCPIWMDNVAVPASAPDVENARLFQNFIMDPENAALISAYARHANGIMGSEPFMPADMKGAPEIDVPAEFRDKGSRSPACPPEVTEIHTKIWTDVLK